MKELHLNKELKGGGIMAKDIEYINEDIESAYEAAKHLERIKYRNRSLVKWTRLGEVIVNEKTKRPSKD